MIVAKKKICKGCQKESYIWARGKCKPCASKDYKKPNPISDKRKEQLKDYSVLRKEFLEDNPNCMAKLVGCGITATDIHHSNGRTNDKLNDTKDWLALCRACHDLTHSALSAAEARKIGLKK